LHPSEGFADAPFALDAQNLGITAGKEAHDLKLYDFSGHFSPQSQSLGQMSGSLQSLSKTGHSAHPNFVAVAERGADALNPVLFYLAVVYRTMVAVTSMEQMF
jgi:hypothetical protein